MAGSIVSNASSYFDEMSALLKKVDTKAIDAYSDLLFRAWKDDRAVFVFGNGGSAYTASHHVTDYVKTAAVEGVRRLRAFSMVDNLGLLTACGNDLCYDDIMSYPLASYARPGDLAIAISCSGNSGNVLRACEWARKNKMTVVVLTGLTGGKLKDLGDVHINVPSDNYGLVEDVHLSIGHIGAQSLKSRVTQEGMKR
jgi:D-sedoheptulose 7-phosphate isomerase